MPTHNELDRRTYLKTTGLATAGMVGLAGCAGGDGTGSGGDGTNGDGTDGDDTDGETAFGTLSTSVTDQPSAIDDFESLTVTLVGIWIKPAGGDGDSQEMDDDEEMNDSQTSMNESDDEMNESDEDMEGEEMDEEDQEDVEDDEGGDDTGRRYIEFEEPQEADLVQLQGSSTKLIDETEVEAGDYEFLQLDVSSTRGVLTDGSDANVRTPGEAPLKFNKSFEVRADQTTRFIADFAPNKRGQNGYIIRPVATSTTVLYGDEEYQGGDSSSTDGGNETMDDGSMDGGNETTSGNKSKNGSQSGNGSSDY